MNGNTIDVEKLKNLIKGLGWAKFLAIMSILGGVLNIFTCIGIPLGIFAILVGLKLWGAANDLSSFKTLGNVSHLYSGMEKLSSYFTLAGWFTIISIILAIISLIVYFILISIGILGSMLSDLESL